MQEKLERKTGKKDHMLTFSFLFFLIRNFILHSLLHHKTEVDHHLIAKLEVHLDGIQKWWKPDLVIIQVNFLQIYLFERDSKRCQRHLELSDQSNNFVSLKCQHRHENHFDHGPFSLVKIGLDWNLKKYIFFIESPFS